MQKKISILAIEDDDDLRQSVTAYYKDCGYTVYEAENGSKGVELFKTMHPDLVVTDLRMPEKDGLRVISEITACDPDTPIIVLSGAGQVRDSVEAIRNGAWDYVTKPIVNFEELELSIKRVLEKVELKRTNRQNT